jgi:Uncharacterized conserved protein (DUF2190)
MTALAADRATKYRDGIEVEYLVKTNQQIYAGSLVAVDANGLLVPGADTAGLVFVGVALENVKGDGVKKCRVRLKGVFNFFSSGRAQADVGALVYLADDQTVALTATNSIPCGRIAKVDSATSVWIDIDKRWVS